MNNSVCRGLSVVGITFRSSFRLTPTRTAFIREMYSSFKSESPMDGRLIGAQVIFRHGARTPVYTVSINNPSIPEVSWDPDIHAEVPHTVVPFALCDVDGTPTSNELASVEQYITIKELPGGARRGLLTRRGQEEMYEMGQRLRRRYVQELGFVPAQFDPRAVYCRSTRYPRNIATTRSVLAGFFGRAGVDENEPPKIHVSSFEDEILSPNRFTCSYVADCTKANVEVTDFPPGMLALRQKAVDLLGESAVMYPKTMGDGTVKPIVSRLHCVRDDLLCRIYHGKPVPDEVRVLVEEMNRLCPYEMAENVCGPERMWRSVGMKAAAGPMCQLILDNLANHAQPNSGSPRLHMYATHDDMLITLLLLLDLFDDQWPKFGADLVIELYETKSRGHVVQLHYCEKLIAEMPLKDLQEQLKEFATTLEEHRRVCTFKPE